MKKYTIRTGCSFRDDKGKLLTGGDTIELEDDVAKMHAEKVEPVQTSGPDKSEALDPPSSADGPTTVGGTEPDDVR